MLHVNMLWNYLRARTSQLRDEDGAINTTEVIVILAIVVAVALIVFKTLGDRVKARAESVNLG